MAKGTFGSENVQKLYARSGKGQGSDVVYVIEFFDVLMSKNCTGAVAKSTFGSENVKKHDGFRSTFVCSDVEKLHAAVAKSTFASENVQKL